MVGVVACGSAKRPVPAPAAQLYTSHLFRASAAFVQTHATEWVILSALHGIVSPNTVIAPYETSLRDMNAAERKAWARMVQRQLAERYPDTTEYVTTAGKLYRAALPADRTFCPWTERPDMRFGHQMHWMKVQQSNPTWKPRVTISQATRR
jgi:hypothetical protein